MEFLRRGQHSHLTLQINFTHLKKGHTTLNSKCSNDQTAPRPHAEGASFCAYTAPGQLANGKQKQMHQRPKMRPLRPQTMAAGWGIGTAGSARKNRRLLTLPDGAASRRQ